MEGIQEICLERQCDRSGDRGHYWRRIRQIISSLIDDIIMPVFGWILGGINLTNRAIVIGYAIIKYGSFLQTVLDFLIVSFSIFAFIQFFHRIRHEDKQAAPAAKPSKEEQLLTKIRDLLKNKK